jgi:hypothetical protein
VFSAVISFQLAAGSTCRLLRCYKISPDVVIQNCYNYSLPRVLYADCVFAVLNCAICLSMAQQHRMFECLAHNTTGSIEWGLLALNLGWALDLRWDPAAATIRLHSVVAQLRCGSGSRAVWPGRIAKSGRCDCLHSHVRRRRYSTTASRRKCRGVAALTDQPTKSASNRDAPDGQAVSGKPLAMPVWRSGQ